MNIKDLKLQIPTKTYWIKLLFSSGVEKELRVDMAEQEIQALKDYYKKTVVSKIDTMVTITDECMINLNRIDFMEIIELK